MDTVALNRLLTDDKSQERQTLVGLVIGVVFPFNNFCRTTAKKRIHSLYDARIKGIIIDQLCMYALVDTGAKIPHKLYIGKVPEEHQNLDYMPEFIQVA